MSLGVKLCPGRQGVSRERIVPMWTEYDVDPAALYDDLATLIRHGLRQSSGPGIVLERIVVSGIFGLFKRSGAPVSTATLQTMHEAMAYWGPDGSGMWHDGPMGLGHLLLYNTPEARHEQLPRWYPEYRLAFTAEARIDNRDELCDSFEISHAARPRTPDGSLILRAYLKWGEDCPDYLLGDWSFAVWRPDDRRLFLARDHHGNTALYYYLDERCLAFASCKKALLALPDVTPTLNELRLAQILVSWPGDGTQTVHEAILRLPPAHTLTVTPERVKKHRYWALEDTPPLLLKSDEAYVEGFLDVFTEAVRCRLRSYRPVGVTLSGGLDSGAVTAVAARELHKQGQRLPAFNSVPVYDSSNTSGRNRFGDERPLATATAEAAGNVDLTFIHAENVSLVTSIQHAIELHDAPGHAAANQFWIISLFQAVQRHGLGTLLSGQGGNATISWPGLKEPPSLTVLLEKQAYRQVFTQMLLHPLVPTRLLRRYRLWRKEGTWRWPEQPWLDYSAIHPNWARQLDLTTRMADAGHDPHFLNEWSNSRQARYAIIRPGSHFGGALWAEKSAGYNVEGRDPTVDKRVMMFCLAIPDTVYQERDGVDRRLIRQSMQGLLPDEVRLNQRRGFQAADIGHRVLQQTAEVHAALDELATCEPARQVLDLERMALVLHAAESRIDQDTTKKIIAILLRGLAVGMFLAQQQDGH
ncbi:MAG: asparagine synthetase B [Chloroflexi bacterium]|nr:asparagine synthetase B [Chloroflexota bacterium]MBU1750464.1 asparagine synthetase B [Chloroflexota bacterium]